MNTWSQGGRGRGGKVLILTNLINLVSYNIRNKAIVSASEFELENNQVKKFPECVY